MENTIKTPFKNDDNEYIYYTYCYNGGYFHTEGAKPIEPINLIKDELSRLDLIAHIIKNGDILKTQSLTLNDYIHSYIGEFKRSKHLCSDSKRMISNLTDGTYVVVQPRGSLQFFDDHQAAFYYFNNVHSAIKGVYGIEKGDFFAVNITCGLFTNESLTLDNQLIEIGLNRIVK